MNGVTGPRPLDPELFFPPDVGWQIWKSDLADCMTLVHFLQGITRVIHPKGSFAEACIAD